VRDNLMLDMQNPPLIVMAKMDSDSFDLLDSLRRQHFPSERNHLSAHMTLFHYLPSERLEEIEEYLKITASLQYEFKLPFAGVKFIGQSTTRRI
jgi:hypothetical protein